MSNEQNFVFLIAEAQAGPADALVGDDELQRHVQLPGLLRHATEVSISRQQLMDFWKEKVVGLTDILSQAQAENATKGFQVDEISFSLGVSAKGGVFFVAEGSIEATMSVTLRRSRSSQT